MENAQRRSRRTAASSTRSKAATITAGVVCAVIAVHMVFTLTYNIPSAELKRSLPGSGLATSYMEPLFVQDYKIFAPDPAGADHQLWVRAWSENRDGEPWTSEWVNVSAVELSDTYRKVLRKQLTIVGAERGMSGYQGLTDEQRDIVGRNYHRSTLDALREDLIAADPAGATSPVDSFIRSTRYVDAYATQVAFALWGDEDDIDAVQTRVVYDPVIRWADRNDPDASRPAATITDTGWHPLLEYPGQNREAFASTFLEWAND